MHPVLSMIFAETLTVENVAVTAQAAAAPAAEPAWVPGSNQYHMLLDVKLKHSPEGGSARGVVKYDPVDHRCGTRRRDCAALGASKDLCQNTVATLGPKFDQEKFHDVLLAQGLLPPDRMRKAVMEEFVPGRRTKTTAVLSKLISRY